MFCVVASFEYGIVMKDISSLKLVLRSAPDLKLKKTSLCYKLIYRDAPSTSILSTNQMTCDLRLKKIKLIRPMCI